MEKSEQCTHLCRLEPQRSGPECRHLSQLENVRTLAPAGRPEYELNKEKAEKLDFINNVQKWYVYLKCPEPVELIGNFWNTSVQTFTNKLPVT
jgi:hypothetical protein